MRAKISQRLVIDASVARSAGPETATVPISKRCRDFLRTTLTVCHRCVFTPAINEEWKKHQSAFARTWRTAMVARKKLLFVEVSEDRGLRGGIQAAAGTERASEAMLKDAHLIEAASAADRTVISLDDKARDLFAEVSRKVPALRSVLWVNPGETEDAGRAWLEGGAPPLGEHRLDARTRKR